MSKIKNFVKNQMLEKALDGYRIDFRYGERLELYNNMYKVLHSQDKGYTLLEDEKNSKIAFPTNKLRLLHKQGLCRNHGCVVLKSDSVEKAQISGPGSKVGVTPKAINAAYAKQSGAKSSEPRGEPVGTVKNGKDGDTYKKTSANPAVWVRVSSGTVHHSPDGEEQDPMSVSHETRQQFHSMMSKIDSQVHPEDREKIQKKAQEWVGENAKFKHMQAAHNTNEVDDKGQKMPKTGISSGTMNQVYAQGDKARKLRQELIDMVKTSHKRVKGEASAK